ncbi:MAG TPA: NAD-dependent epimerase/dehydratase family protein [Propionibacteriaceae bacterium]|nr:NAD-dependent epimerase/dehydratase family protein [Propionibacteriaceae bacterium]
MRVLVTGSTGMLGRDVALALADRGDQVTVLQRHPAGLGLREVLTDISDAQSVRAAASNQDAVIHLAAKVNVIGPKAEYQRVNVQGTRAVVNACVAAGVRRLVHVSSPSVAHSGTALIGRGADPANPVAAVGPYARSKAAAELIALGADRGQLAVVAIRPHLVWGPGDTQLVARVVERADRGRLPLIGSGAALIDSTYVVNAVEALLAALDRCVEARGQALVVTNGEPLPIAELLAAVCRAAGAPEPKRHVPVQLARAGGTLVESLWTWTRGLRAADNGADPPLTRFLVEQLSTAHWFDQRATRQVLQWQPRVTLDEGFAELQRWYSSLPRTGS